MSSSSQLFLRLRLFLLGRLFCSGCPAGLSLPGFRMFSMRFSHLQQSMSHLVSCFHRSGRRPVLCETAGTQFILGAVLVCFCFALDSNMPAEDVWSKAKSTPGQHQAIRKCSEKRPYVWWERHLTLQVRSLCHSAPSWLFCRLHICRLWSAQTPNGSVIWAKASQAGQAACALTCHQEIRREMSSVHSDSRNSRVGFQQHCP